MKIKLEYIWLDGYNELLTPKEKELLKSKGYKIKNKLKENVPLLKSIRALRKNPR